MAIQPVPMYILVWIFEKLCGRHQSLAIITRFELLSDNAKGRQSLRNSDNCVKRCKFAAYIETRCWERTGDLEMSLEDW